MKVCTPPSLPYFWHVWKQNRFPLLNDIGSQGLPRTMQLGHQWNMHGRNCGTAEIPQTPKNPWRPFFFKRFSSFSRFHFRINMILVECGRRCRTWFHHLCWQGLWKAMDADLLRNSERFCQVKRALPHCQLWTALAVTWTMQNHDIMHPSARTICVSICVFVYLLYIYIYSIGECLDDYRCPVWRKRAHVTPT